MSAKLAQKKLPPYRTQEPEDAGQLEGRDAVNLEHEDGLGVVAEHQRPALVRPPPLCLLAEGDLKITDIHPHVGFKRIELAAGRDWRGRRCTRKIVEPLHQQPYRVR